MRFNKDDLINITYGEHENFSVIKTEITDTSRWSIHHRCVFKDLSNSKFYETHYSEGATESQDESRYEYADDEIECKEVFEKTKKITYYE